MLDKITDWLGRKQLKQRVCCFHFGRCGSTLLGNMLNSHPDIQWCSELFHEHFEKPEKQHVLQPPFELLSESLQQSRGKSYGFETKFQHLNPKGLNIELGEFVTRLKEMGFSKFILLRRRNYLRQAISVARGQLTKTWHVRNDQEKPEFPKFEFDMERVGLGGRNRKILECFEFIDKTYDETTQWFQSSSTKLLELTYEDDLEHNATVGYQKTLSFLDLGQSTPNISLQKLGNQSVSEMITNFPEIRRHLADTRYAWMCKTSAR